MQVQKSNSPGVEVVVGGGLLWQKQLTEYFTVCLKNHAQEAAQTCACLLCREHFSIGSLKLTLKHISRWEAKFF